MGGCVEGGNKEENRMEYDELPTRNACKILSIFNENSISRSFVTFLTQSECENGATSFQHVRTCSDYKYSRHTLPFKNSSSFFELVSISCLCFEILFSLSLSLRLST